ncbi:MAG: hypothetical protein HNEKOMLI_00702 [Sodalis sp. Psp]|nr:hypothetical protein [Sodalis sp. Psp]MCR3757321.1 hypothetical protein [Sodalis sp. Ppy]
MGIAKILYQSHGSIANKIFQQESALRETESQ